MPSRIGTTPTVNRFAEREDPIDTIARDFEIHDIQLTAESFFANADGTQRMGASLARAGAWTGESSAPIIGIADAMSLNSAIPNGASL